ncbi:hypothetical protein BpHYR1_003918 [Brachionus plicatilis]|uniref:RNA-directed DNA polymerase from mobile element jockey-like n=1 Tax=Brachionus plicatilis TaxID=10195 RepID=A0A3M7REC7_BRAPC|nr:hypothetical protein BpHYR1_003918 [Brachionus plicatilis]
MRKTEFRRPNSAEIYLKNSAKLPTKKRKFRFLSNINKTDSEYSLLFADDLVTFYIFKKKGNLENKINKYSDELDKWLFKWKMKISCEKSCFIILAVSIEIYTNSFQHLALYMSCGIIRVESFSRNLACGIPFSAFRIPPFRDNRKKNKEKI